MLDGREAGRLRPLGRAHRRKNNIRTGEHTGTHLDAPNHWVTGKDKEDVAQIPPRRLIGPAAVIDKVKEAAENPDYLLDVPDLEAWQTEHGPLPDSGWLLFRKRMEVIRDDLMDAILNDKVRETRSVQRFLRAVEASTELPRRVTLPRIFAVAQAAVDSGIDIEAAARQPRFSDLEPAERLLMEDLNSRLCEAYISYLTWGSSSALLLKPLLTLIAGSDAKARP